MDERNLPKAATGIIGPGHPEQGAQPGAGSMLVFFGDPEQVRDGFVLALHAIGITATTADVTCTSRPNRGNGRA